MNMIVSVLFCVCVGFFLSIRISEISSVICTDLAGAFVIILALVGSLSLFLKPARTAWLKVRRFALVTLVRI